MAALAPVQTMTARGAPLAFHPFDVYTEGSEDRPALVGYSWHLGIFDEAVSHKALHQTYTAGASQVVIADPCVS